jgi:hypothetical protein
MTKPGDAVRHSAMISNEMSANKNGRPKLEMIGRGWKWSPRNGKE